MNTIKIIVVIVVLLYVSALSIFIANKFLKEPVKEIEPAVPKKEIPKKEVKIEEKPKEEKKKIIKKVEEKEGLDIENFKVTDGTVEKNKFKKNEDIYISFKVSGFSKNARAYLPPVSLQKTNVINESVTIDLKSTLQGYYTEETWQKFKDYIDEAEIEELQEEINRNIAENIKGAMMYTPVITKKDIGIRYDYGVKENIETTYNRLVIPEMTFEAIKDLSFRSDTYPPKINIVNKITIPDNIRSGDYVLNVTIVDKVSLKTISYAETISIE